MASTANTPGARALGAELLRLRKAAGRTMIELGQAIGRSHTHISRWENGKLVPTVEEVARVLGVLGVAGEEFDSVVRLAREAADPNWVAPGVVRHLAMLTGYERTASRITNVQPLLIPGLLQTADYARSIMLSAGATVGEAEQRTTHRMGRQHVLTRPRPVRLDAVIGEHALRYPPCSADVMADQLHALLKWARMDNVTIRAVPSDSGYLPILEGAFVLIEFEKAAPVVQLEHYRSATTLTDRRDVRDYQTAADTMRQQAMSPADTEEFIASLASGMESGT
ncbi:helix-turn-helix transcriptional regulator [Saccharomonospora xinjiangensis]|uniref:helix-turn-helix domain-containing protein n=1 Tax=Saccharomonospora xinjiangensis TaxID=75294 RepID=UPI00106F93D0|nr:helix-turn-helix transcriptional regulator [Saccharomonospora xinjiangensis]QBQ62465.1 Helix-turn-helix protein [Saccharomonospora xinjiangensis]